MFGRMRGPLIAVLISTVLLLLAFAGTVAISFPLWTLYRTAAGLAPARTIALVAAGLSAAAFFVAAVIVAIATALHPAGRWRKLLYVLPVEFLGFVLVDLLFALFGIGTTGSFTATWLGVSGFLSVVAVVIAALRMPLGIQTVRRVITAVNAAGILSLVAWLGMLAALAIVLTSQPSTRAGFQNGGAPAGAPPVGATTTASDQGPPDGAGQPGFEGPRGPGGPRASTTTLLIGVALMTVFAVGTSMSILRGRRVMRDSPLGQSGPIEALPVDYRHEAGQAVFSCLAITIVALSLAQLVPAKRDNPPAQQAVQWDSPQTRSLAQRACMDCHSNETTWPWYAYVAPGSWLLRNHVSDGRAALNFSELNNAPSFRASRLPEEAGQQIRNGSMPPSDYLILHPAARLTAAEKDQLIQGLQKSLSQSLAKST